MKLVHVLALLLVVIGGLHFAMTAIGVDLFGSVFGAGVHLTIVYLLIGISTLYFSVPMLRSHLHKL